jgi:DNA-binding CsgD family transcriptional regulator
MSTCQEFRQLVETFLEKLEHSGFTISAFHLALGDLLDKTPADDPVLRQIASDIRALPLHKRSGTGDMEALSFKVREMREHLITAQAAATRRGMQEAKAATPQPLMPLPTKRQDLSGYFFGAGLTEQQRQCFSLRFEYGLRTTDIAKRMGIHHSTVQQHIQAAKVKVELSRNKGKRRKNIPDE